LHGSVITNLLKKLGVVGTNNSQKLDSGYPVPELSTLALMGSGLVVGVGLLAYSNKSGKK